MGTITFKHGVVCDDIRQENNGKFLIIGMYSGSLVPPKLPYATQVAFGIWAIVSEAGPYNCKFELVLEPDHSPVARAESEFFMPDGERNMFIPLPRLPLNIGGPGYIVVKETLTGQEVVRLKVTTPRPSSGEPERPASQSATAAPESSSPPGPSHPDDRKKRRRARF